MAQKEAGKERQRARVILRSIGNTLAPDLRGQRGRVHVDDPDLVARQYYRALFRRHQIRHFLKQHRTIRHKDIENVSRTWGVPIEDLCRYWGLDENFERHSHPLSIRDIAFLETAFRFNITVETVQNLLSSY